jgi:hypothetical protein
MNYLYKAPKTSVYVYRIKEKNIYGSIKFKTKVKTIEDMFNEIKDVKDSLIKKYKTKKISIMKEIIND